MALLQKLRVQGSLKFSKLFLLSTIEGCRAIEVVCFYSLICFFQCTVTNNMFQIDVIDVKRLYNRHGSEMRTDELSVPTLYHHRDRVNLHLP